MNEYEIKVDGLRTVLLNGDNCFGKSGDKLCRVTDSSNGYQVKFYAPNSFTQDSYLTLDYDEAEFLYKTLAHIFSVKVNMDEMK